MHLKQWSIMLSGKNARSTSQNPLKATNAAVSEIIAKYRQTGLVQINESDAKKILSAYGINTASGALVNSAEEAAKQSEKIGYPLVMKIVSPDIIHKSDVGGVILHLKSSAQVSDAFSSMMVAI